MTLKDHSTEAEKLIAMGEEDAKKWVASTASQLERLPGKAGEILQNLILGSFKAGYMKGVERTAELLSKRLDQVVEPVSPTGRKDYGDGEGGPVS